MYINVVSPFVNQPPPNLPSMADIWLSECIFILWFTALNKRGLARQTWS